MARNNMCTLVAYVPVLHDGYRRFFEKYEGEKELHLFGPEIIAQFPWLTKEIRQLDPAAMQQAIEALGIFSRVSVLDIAGAKSLDRGDKEIVLPDEDVSREAAVKYFPKAKLIFDPIFLRWDKHNALRERQAVPDERITHEELHRCFMAQVEEESKKSSDIWRHVGAAIVKGGKTLLMGHNKHVPSQHTPYQNGDPRSNWSRGVHMELSTALHAEAGLIAEAARQGVELQGADMYVTVYPCPPCAKLVAHAGIKNLYCGGGNPILDAEDVLKSKGVNIIFVE